MMSSAGAGRGPTLRRIADRLGVSVATVSNAFNRPDQLSDQLRARILEAAAEAGYSGPDPTARALSTGRHGAIGVVYSEALRYAFTDPAAIATLEGVADFCHPEQLNLVLLPADHGDAESAARIVRAPVDGLILLSLPDDDAVALAALARAVPVVTVDQPQLADTAFVGIDDRDAARQAVTHLTSLGHHRIGFVGYRLTPDRRRGRPRASSLTASRYRSTRERLAGFADGLEAADLSLDDLMIEECHANTAEEGASVVGQLLDAPGRHPTALIFDSDRLALGALAAAHERGVQVPEDLSLVGFDDVPQAAMATPPLTTIRQPFQAKGRAAAELLLAGRSGTEPARIFGSTLVVRGTTGPPSPAG